MSQDQQQNQSFENLYEVVKTIRFNLLPEEDKSTQKPTPKLSDEKFKSEISEFITSYKQVIANFKEITFIKDEGAKQILNSNIKIKIQWLKDFAKQDFHENKDKLIKTRFDKRQQRDVKTNTNVSLGEAGFLQEKFEKLIDRNYLESEDSLETKGKVINELEKLNTSKLHNQGRKADFAYWMHKINHRNNFIFIYELFNGSIQDKTSDKKIIETFEILKKCKTQIENIQNYLRPSQSFGLEIEKTSLNYYTVNKKPKAYDHNEHYISFERAIEIEKKKFSDPIFDLEYRDKKSEKKVKKFPKTNLISVVGFENYIVNLDETNFVEQKFGNLVKIDKIYNRLKLESLYISLKQFKAEQKSKFYEYIFHILENYKENQGYTFDQNHYDQCLQKFPIFNFYDTEIQFNKFVEQSKIIRDSSNNANQNKAKIKPLKEARGKYFDVQNGTCAFNNYKNFCELFKSVATEYGRIKAKIKSLEKEEVEAQRLQSWSVLLQKDNKHHLVTIPKEKARETYGYISNLESDQNANQSIWLIESLTLRALDKLCFGENSSFRSKIMAELEEKFPGYFEKDKNHKLQLIRKDQFSVDGKELIYFYQDILTLESTADQILINSFLDTHEKKCNLTDVEFVDLAEFQSHLEAACYIKKEVKVSETEFNKIKNKFGAKVYEITSYDLEKDRNNPEEHTNIWKEFCSLQNRSGYKTRLNPEMKISYVEKRVDSILDKNGKEVKRNRRKQTEFILSTTISQHNDKPKFDMSFKDKDLIKEKITDFNNNLNSEINPNNVWYYGLDRGQEELLTLGLFKFPQKKEEYETKDENWNKTVVGGEFEVWELPEDKLYEEKLKPDQTNGSKVVAYKNISYFTDLLVPKKVSCLDLTCAKLIGDKIVINGDIQTYLNIKLVSAYRKITKGIQNGNFESDQIKIYKKKDVLGNEISDEVLSLKIINRDEIKEYDLYYFDTKYAGLLSLEKLKDLLQTHYHKIKEGNSEEDNYSIEKINHLRDAICANSTGIINHLQKTKVGYICFEDLDQKQKKEHFEEWNFNLGSRVEIMLLNKFKTLGFVPPSYKMAMSMQSNKELNQFGIITYVETSGTSSNCPNCSQRIDQKTKNLNKWGNHRFRCMNNGVGCGFNTYLQDEIDKRKSEEAEANKKQPDQTKHTNNWDFTPDKKGLDFLQTSDDVATYNIAKRGLELIQKNI